MVWCYLPIIHFMRIGLWVISSDLSPVALVSSICQAQVVDCLTTSLIRKPGVLRLLCYLWWYVGFHKWGYPKMDGVYGKKKNTIKMDGLWVRHVWTPPGYVIGSEWSDLPHQWNGFCSTEHDQMSGSCDPLVSPIFKPHEDSQAPRPQLLRQGACLCGRVVTLPKS